MPTYFKTPDCSEALNSRSNAAFFGILILAASFFDQNETGFLQKCQQKKILWNRICQQILKMLYTFFESAYEQKTWKRFFLTKRQNDLI
jgi:hypothetical protein